MLYYVHNSCTICSVHWGIAFAIVQPVFLDFVMAAKYPEHDRSCLAQARVPHMRKTVHHEGAQYQ